MRVAAALLTLCCSCAVAVSQSSARNQSLRAFFIDVEGGQSTLFVSPSGESLLVDTGWPGNEGRDADRIVATAKHAGLQRIDYVLVTHYHVDHAGGIPQLVARIPVGTFIDHGPNRELDHGITEKDYAEYEAVLAKGASHHLVPRPGERLPIKGFEATVISADGNLISSPLEGAGQQNPFCAASEIRPEDQTENSRSLGIEISFGNLKILDLGDLTWDKERALMCPRNKVGTVDVLVVSHHGWIQSSSPALVDAIHARVAIMDNGAKKGGTPATIQTIKAAPGLQALWQLHFSDEAGPTINRDAKYIANPQGTDAGNGLELTGERDGTFTVRNPVTGFEQRYGAASSLK